MAGRTITRSDIAEAVRREVRLSRSESDSLVKSALDAVANAVVAGDSVKVSGFGTFTVRQKRGRVGRNPKTGIEVPISPRRVLTFRASQVMRGRISRSSGS